MTDAAQLQEWLPDLPAFKFSTLFGILGASVSILLGVLLKSVTDNYFPQEVGKSVNIQRSVVWWIVEKQHIIEKNSGMVEFKIVVDDTIYTLHVHVTSCG